MNNKIGDRKRPSGTSPSACFHSRKEVKEVLSISFAFISSPIFSVPYQCEELWAENVNAPTQRCGRLWHVYDTVTHQHTSTSPAMWQKWWGGAREGGGRLNDLHSLLSLRNKHTARDIFNLHRCRSFNGSVWVPRERSASVCWCTLSKHVSRVSFVSDFNSKHFRIENSAQCENLNTFLCLTCSVCVWVLCGAVRLHCLIKWKKRKKKKNVCGS